MRSGIVRKDLRWGTFLFLLFVWLSLLSGAARVASGEGLSSEDIAALRRQGEVEGWTFTVGENSATRYSLNDLCGMVPPKDWWVGARFDPCAPTKDLPERFDWRDVNGCTPIRNQGGCGSCWAFGTVGALECNIKIKDNVSANLSEQWLVSCNSNGWSCGGGWWAHDYHEWKTDPCGGTGAVLESEFPYVASDVPCDCPYPHEYFIDDWAYIGSSHGIPPVDNIKQAIMDWGPVSVTVHANSAMQAYNGGIFNACQYGTINHAVVLVGWDDNQGSNGVWFMRNSWGSGWGEGGYMRIPYDCSRIGYAACYVDFPGSVILRMSLPDGAPDLISPGEPTSIRVQIDESFDTYVQGTGTLHYRFDGDAFHTVPLVSLGGDLYEALLPAASCSAVPEYYFSAEGVNTGEIYQPFDAPATTYSSSVGEYATIMTDDFEDDLGWTVYNSPDLTDGAWGRGVPVGGGDRGDPPTDFDGSGQCFLTDNVDGNSDVDDGYTWLQSPPIDLSDAIDAEVSFALWYTNDAGGDPNNDYFKVFVSFNDGHDWYFVKVIGPESIVGWKQYSFMVNNYVPLTSQVRVRFEASDIGEGSVVEAGIDAFTVSAFRCVSPEAQFVRGDANADGEHSIYDGLRILSWLGGTSESPPCLKAADVDDDGQANLFDALRILNWLGGVIPSLAPPCCSIPGSCGDDETPDALTCESYTPCGWNPRAPAKIASVASTEESWLAVDREVFDEGALIVPVTLFNAEPLVGYSFILEYDAAQLKATLVDNAGLITEGFDFFVGGTDEVGLVKVLSVADLDMGDGVELMPAGEHVVARIHFQTLNTMPRNVSLRFTNSTMAIDHQQSLDHSTKGRTIGAMDRLPGDFALFQNYPNPFNPTTEITYALPQQCQVRLDIFNLLGERVATLVDEHQPAGQWTVQWGGEKLASGVYLYRLQAGPFTETRRMLLLK